MFRNKDHEIHTVEVNKIALNRDDDKRIAKKDGVSTLVRGHCSLCFNSLLGVISLEELIALVINEYTVKTRE